MDKKVVEELVTNLLKEIGEDPKREGLIATPKRVAKAYEFLTSGYTKNIELFLTMLYSMKSMMRWCLLRTLISIVCVNITCFLFMVKYMWHIFRMGK